MDRGEEAQEVEVVVVEVAVVEEEEVVVAGQLSHK